MELHGVHHVTAVTSVVSENLRFYTEVLGLRLVKKSVNQDDVSAYHLFYADKLGTPGWDMTFFDWPQIGPNKRGTDSIANTMFRVNGRSALDFWQKRFDTHQVTHNEIEQFAGRDILRFQDSEGQRLTLVDDQGAPFPGEPWDKTDIPLECAIHGFHGVTLSARGLGQLEPILTQVLGFKKVDQLPATDNSEAIVTIFAMEEGGPGKEVHVREQPYVAIARLGNGGVHHVAYRVSDDAEQRAWNERLTKLGVGTSGIIDRYYFKSLYFRISPGILFELAIDGPGFASDEPVETLGEHLALPPFLEPYRDQIEAGLKPL